MNNKEKGIKLTVSDAHETWQDKIAIAIVACIRRSRNTDAPEVSSISWTMKIISNTDEMGMLDEVHPVLRLRLIQATVVDVASLQYRE